MSAACTFEGCTVGETGSCALERDPTTCEHRVTASSSSNGPVDDAEAEASAEAGGLGAPVLDSPATASSFPSSRTLGPDVVSALMASRYVTVVGILGDPESGKTACLASLYLLVSNAALEGWTFADSKSLMGFEDIARGAREWNEGTPPEQMTVHTEMVDERRPGFLHLRLVRMSDGRRLDLALPDLPGEWTTALIATAKSERLEFLRSAEVIWIVVDGRTLADREKRQGVVTRLGQLVNRLKTLIGDTLPRLVVLATHRDNGALEPSVLSRIAAELAKKEVAAEVIEIAPFSSDKAVKPGHGLLELLGATAGVAPTAPALWPVTAPKAEGRAFLRYRSHA